MKKATISELKNQLSRFLAYVRRGGTVQVYDRDTPIAWLVASRPLHSGDVAAELLALERNGIIRRAAEALPEDFLDRKLPVAKAAVVDALLDERRGSR
jgi:antitoxin (DNA-binding transcriptional repressor) of toxin-antitoxin stability system